MSAWVCDARGIARLVTDATIGVTDLVDAVHASIASPALHPRRRRRTRGVTGLVYGSVRGVARLSGACLDTVLGALATRATIAPSSPARDAVLSALNGVVGDHIAATGNPLAIPMRLRYAGGDLVLERASLEAGIPHPRRRLVVFLHGLCMNDLQWKRDGHDHGAALARDLKASPITLRYNSGLHVSVNGRAFADLLEDLVREWPVPVERLVIVGFSMGGLVARSALHYAAGARHAWPRSVGALVFLGTPHHGAIAERIGNVAEHVLGATPYAAPFAKLGRLRSAGITDLRYGNLVDEDWKGLDRFDRAGDRRTIVPLPEDVPAFAIAATRAARTGGRGDRLVGDGLVPLPSALGRHREPARCLGIPEARTWVGTRMSHLDLLGCPEVHETLRRWLVAL